MIVRHEGLGPGKKLVGASVLRRVYDAKVPQDSRPVACKVRARCLDGNGQDADPPAWNGCGVRFGKGEAGRLGAPAGDLHINTNVGSHKHFTRKGDNIYVTVPITVPEAALGSKIEVPTVEGKAQLRIPPGTQSGQKFRLRQRGAPSLRKPGAKGDQFVEVQVTLPKVISEETKELLRQYSKMNSENPRVEMGLE